MTANVKSEPTTLEKMQGLKWAVGFTAANSVYVQLTFFGSLFVLFLDTLGFSKTEIGGLLSLLPLTGLIALFIGPQMARFGYKRAFLTFFTFRTIASAFLLFTPLVITWVTGSGVLFFIVIILIFFSIFRSIGLSGWMPWNTEFVPPSVRGKYSAFNNISSNAGAFITVTLASLALGDSPTITDFNLMFGIGIAFAVISLGLMARVPGGAPIATSGQTIAKLGEILSVFKDRNMTKYIIGRSLVGLAMGPLASFVPLFMAEKVGLNSGQIIFLQTGALLGGLLSSYIWGWAADRYGSKPIMLWGTILMSIMPIFWILMPKLSIFSIYFALGIALFKGISEMSWNIGATTTLFVSIVPIQKRASYMALHYAMMGISGAVSQVVSGYLLDATADLQLVVFGYPIDSYTILFLIAVILPLVAGLFMWNIRAKGDVGVGEFAGMFLRGNPVLAMSSMIGFHRARDEKSIVQQTERLGKAQSPLNVEELLRALRDPRFNVRYEAVISIARHAPNEKLTAGLVNVLEGKDPALASLAAWAMGRVGDVSAIAALRGKLETDYRSVKGYCIRALGTLDDQESREQLIKAFELEEDTGLQLAYASALSKFAAVESIPRLLTVLADKHDLALRSQFAMALAEIIGDQNHYIETLRNYPDDPGTIVSQEVVKLANTKSFNAPALKEQIMGAANEYARQDFETGNQALLEFVDAHLDLYELNADCSKIANNCIEHLRQDSELRYEYLLLLIFILLM